MTKAKWLICAAVLAAFAVLAVACGGFTQAVKEGISLKFAGQLYQRYQSQKNKPPANADDLLSVATTQEEKDAVQAIKDKKIEIIWGVDLNDPTCYPSG